MACDEQVEPLVLRAMRATHDFRTFKSVHDLLHSRSESSMNPAKEWLDNFMDDAENRFNLTQEQKLVKQEYQEKIIETNEFHGQFALIKPSGLNKYEIYNGDIYSFSLPQRSSYLMKLF